MTSGPETSYRVRGGAPLNGTVFIQGAKNAALKMIAASLLTPNGHTVLRNVPPIEDVRRAVELAQAVGALVEFHEAERTLVVDASRLTSPVLPAEIARRFRGSVLFVPALLHRFGEAVIEGVGGCNLGSRNLDFHYRGFARLGAVVDEGETVIHIKAGKLQGAHLYLDTPSHTGTENLIMAASLAPGRTIIDNTAQEPEVLDVIAFLTKMGARITGGGTGFITVHGVDELTAVEHTVMADRIDAGVFAMAAAITGGELNLVGASLDHFGVFRWKLEQMGVEFATNGAVLAVRRDRPLRPINVVTSPYPGFATDLQSPIMALACLADGASYIRETIYDGRYTLVGELNKMGAKVELDRAPSSCTALPRSRRRGGGARPAHRHRAGAGGPGRRGRDHRHARLPDRPRPREHRPALQRPRRRHRRDSRLMRVLILGGTRFIGRRIAADLVARGDDVTVVHRGQTEPDQPDGCTHLHADRAEFGQVAEQVRALRPDAVIDTLAMSKADADAVLPHLPDIPSWCCCPASTCTGRMSCCSPIRAASRCRSPRTPRSGRAATRCAKSCQAAARPTTSSTWSPATWPAAARCCGWP